MRTILAFEGIPTIDGRTIESGALYWDRLPLWVLDDACEQVGHITDLEREDSIIWAEVDIKIPEGYVLSLSGGYAEISVSEEPLRVIFKKLRVCGGMVIPTEQWAWK